MVNQALLTLTTWFYTGLRFVREFLGLIDAALHRALNRIGVPVDIQTLLILLVNVVLIVMVFRMFSGLVRALLIVFLILLVLHMLAPALGV